MRRAARTDANKAEIVAAFRSMGASVWDIKWPVDILVGYAGKTCAVEIKTDGKKRYTKGQEEFFLEFRGMAARVETVEDCRLLLGRMAC